MALRRLASEPLSIASGHFRAYAPGGPHGLYAEPCCNAMLSTPLKPSGTYFAQPPLQLSWYSRCNGLSNSAGLRDHALGLYSFPGEEFAFTLQRQGFAQAILRILIGRQIMSNMLVQLILSDGLGMPKPDTLLAIRAISMICCRRSGRKRAPRRKGAGPRVGAD